MTKCVGYNTSCVVTETTSMNRYIRYGIEHRRGVAQLG